MKETLRKLALRGLARIVFTEVHCQWIVTPLPVSLRGRWAVSDRPLAQEKEVQNRFCRLGQKLAQVLQSCTI